ncbi:MAG: hypothetical protein V4668_02715 [Patescibacteria group bacterium]
MEPLPQNSSNTIVTSRYSPLFTVTRVSKSLAVILFLLLPFLGSYVGYKYAEQNTTIQYVQENKSNLNTYKNPATTKEPAIEEQDFSDNISSEKITLDISPFSDSKLAFNVAGQKFSNSPSFSETILFIKETGDIVLQNYNNKSSSNKEYLLRLYSYTSDNNLERYIQDIQLKQFAYEASSSVQNVLIERNNEIKSFILESGRQIDATNIDYYNFCKLKTIDALHNDIYVLRVPEEFSGVALPYLCGVGKYILFENFIVGNFAQPVDASQPKVVPYDDIQLVK